MVECNTDADGAISWVGVAAKMRGRTDNQVMRHWKNQEKGGRCGGRDGALCGACECDAFC